MTTNSHSKDDFVVSEFPDMRLFMSAALRYALPRSSYAPSHFLEYLEKNLDKFSEDSLRLFNRDLWDFINNFTHTDSGPVLKTIHEATLVSEKIENILLGGKKDE